MLCYEVPEEIYADRPKQRDPYKKSFSEIWGSQGDARVNYRKASEDAQEVDYEEMGEGLDGIYADEEALGKIFEANGVYAHEEIYAYEETYGKFAQRFRRDYEPGSINDLEEANSETDTEAGDTNESQKVSKNSQGDHGNQAVWNYGNQQLYNQISEGGFSDKVWYREDLTDTKLSEISENSDVNCSIDSEVNYSKGRNSGSIIIEFEDEYRNSQQ